MVSIGRGPQPNHSTAPGWEHAAPANRGLVAAAYWLIHDREGDTPTEEKTVDIGSAVPRPYRIAASPAGTQAGAEYLHQAASLLHDTIAQRRLRGGSSA